MKVEEAKIMKTLDELCNLAPRLWENEQEAAELIKEKLRKMRISFEVQHYRVRYPLFHFFELRVNGKELPCLPSSLVSGRIREKRVINALKHSHSTNYRKANFNYNPYCTNVSKFTFYEAPALAIRHSDAHTIMKARDVEGEVKVSWKPYTQENIMIGNTENPKKIIMAHYDSWWGGAVDNGLAVALLLHMASKANLKDSLILLAGSEEISHEKIYWCYGYRVFERKFRDVMEQAESIVVVDSIGRGRVEITKDREMIKDALWLRDNSFLNKATGIFGSFRDVMEIYHSPVDTPRVITNLEDCLKVVAGIFHKF